jgi:nucleoside-diphosphate-sugar epimerase
MGDLVIAVTGADGFVGRALCDELDRLGLVVRRIVRSYSPSNIEAIAVGDIDADTDWTNALSGASHIIHCAALVHVAGDSLEAYRVVNVAGTIRLAEQAEALGLKRLIFLSSVKANIDHAQVDPYGASKAEAEYALWRLAREMSLEVVVVRSPLVYGPGVKANFFRLMKLIEMGFPLPFGLVNNCRSLVALDNLVSFLTLCLEHSMAKGRTLYVSDGHDLSTPDLIRSLAKAMDLQVRLLPVPLWLLKLGGRLLGRHLEIERLIGSLKVDITVATGILGWTPPISVEEGLRLTVLGVKSKDSVNH